MITEPFTAGNSVIHSVDPRMKIVFAVMLSCVVAVANSLLTLSAGLATGLMLIVLARLDGRAVLKRLAVVFGFMALIWVVLPVTYPGPAIIALGPLQISQPGVVLCLKITLKSIAILSILIALVATTTLSTIGSALHRLGVPGKLVYLLVMTYRYIFVIENEYQRLMRAARIRGFHPGTNIHSYKTFAYLTGMIFIRASARAENVYRAMLCRGFKGQFHTLGPVAPYTQNRAFTVLTTAALIVILGLEIWNRISL
ncbi:MAG: cobalt ECF transporter T component CbiQ [Thermodesulfobacteriota bacterium]